MKKMILAFVAFIVLMLISLSSWYLCPEWLSYVLMFLPLAAVPVFETGRQEYIKNRHATRN